MPENEKSSAVDGLLEQFAAASAAAQNLTEAEELKKLGLPDNVNIEKADQPFELKPEDPEATGPWIQYNGVGTVRTLNEEEWRAAGVDSDQYCEWNYLNNKRLPRSMFNDAELQYLLRRDGRFSLED